MEGHGNGKLYRIEYYTTPEGESLVKEVMNKVKKIFKDRGFFEDHLKESLKNPKVREAYEEADLPIRLAIEIARLREKKGLTQQELAKKIGTKQQVVSRIENLGENFTIGTLQRIAGALGARLFVSLR